MLDDYNNILNICDYIDHVIGSDKNLFCARMKAVKKELEKSLKLNTKNCCREDLEFLLKRL